MNDEFLELTGSLEGAFQRLIGCPIYRRDTLPRDMPIGGVYLFSESSRPLYVGRSQARLRDRIRDHGSSGKAINNACFAERLVLDVAAAKDPNDMQRLPNGSLLMFSDQEYRLEMARAKQRIATMEVRFVEESHAIRRILLEIYAAVTLATPYNVF